MDFRSRHTWERFVASLERDLGTLSVRQLVLAWSLWRNRERLRHTPRTRRY